MYTGNSDRYPERLFDNNLDTKYCVVFTNDTWAGYLSVTFESNDLIIPSKYVIYTGDDTQSNPGRNPKNWHIDAKVNESDNWTTIHTVTNAGLPNTNKTSVEYTISGVTTAYKYFRFYITDIVSGSTFQLQDFHFIATVTGGGDDNCENFSNISGTSSYSTGGTLPSGWHRIYGGTTETGGTVYDASATTPAAMPHVVSVSATTPGAPSSGNYICFYSNDNGTYSYAIMPPVESGLAVSHISFKYKFESTSNGELTYGVISGTDASTYTVLGSISNPSSNPGTIDVDLNTSQTAGKRIAFRWYKSGTWYTCGIDDICIETSSDITPITIINEIASKSDWETFCHAVNNGHDYSGETVIMTADVTDAVTTMAGVTTGESGYSFAFRGTFDGQGHTLNVNLTSGTLSNGWYYTAPFRVIDGATIMNLKTNGTVTQTEGKGAAGLIGLTQGTCDITNCVSNVTINSLTDGDGTHGGFISEIRGNTTMNGCAFTGSITGSTTRYCGGFVGYKYSGTATLNSCVFAPTEISFNANYSGDNSSNFIRPSGGGTLNNCYYTQTCGSVVQGKLMHSITGLSPVTVALNGEHTYYNLSDIDAYNVGIIYNGTIYAGNGDNVALNLEGSSSGVYMANHGDITGSENPFTLNMTNYDTEISALTCPAPTEVAVSDISAHEATVDWEGTNENYIVKYRTAAYINTPIVQEGFNESTIPSNWTQYTGLFDETTGTVTLSSGSRWIFGTNNGVFDSHARTNVYSTYQAWLVTPSLTVGNGYGLSFDVALTKYSGTLQPVDPAQQLDDKFIVLISTDNKATWTVLRKWDNAGSAYVYNDIACSATGENVTLDLSAYSGQTAYIAFYGESTVSGGDNNLHIDNVTLGALIPAGEWQNVTSMPRAHLSPSPPKCRVPPRHI